MSNAAADDCLISSASTSRDLSSPSEFDHNGPPQPLGCGPSHGVHGPSALAIGGAHMSRACLPGSLRLQGSLALLALSFSTELHGLVSCRARSWALPFEAFPFAEEDQRLSTRSDPRAVGSSGVRLTPARLARLLGVARSGSPLLTRRGFPSRRPLLPWVSASAGVVLPSATRASFLGVPLTSFARALPPSVAPQSLDRTEARRSPWRPPPLARFLHLVRVPR